MSAEALAESMSPFGISQGILSIEIWDWIAISATTSHVAAYCISVLLPRYYGTSDGRTREQSQARTDLLSRCTASLPIRRPPCGEGQLVFSPPHNARISLHASQFVLYPPPKRSITSQCPERNPYQIILSPLSLKQPSQTTTSCDPPLETSLAVTIYPTLQWSHSLLAITRTHSLRH